MHQRFADRVSVWILLNKLRSATCLGGLLLFLATAPSLFAQQATPNTKVGDIVTNPVTGANERVVQLLMDANGTVAHVLTDMGNTFLTLTTVGATYAPQDPASEGLSGSGPFVAASVVTNSTTNLIQTTNFAPTSTPMSTPTSVAVVVDQSAALQMLQAPVRVKHFETPSMGV